MRAKWNVVDRPALVDLAFFVAVALHAGLTWLEVLPNIWLPLTKTDPATQAGLYLGFFGAASLVSSFAGVVVIFALTPQSLRFQKFRVSAGASLSRNWSWTSAVGFLGAALALAAAIASLSGGGWLSPWLLEFAIGLVGHSAIRLILLLKGLVRVVHADDVAAIKKAADRPTSSAPWNASK